MVKYHSPFPVLDGSNRVTPFHFTYTSWFHKSSTQLLNDAIRYRKLPHLSFGRHCKISHVKFAYDKLHCFRTNTKSYHSIKKIFETYEQLTNQRVSASNLSFFFFPKHTLRSIKYNVCSVLGFKEDYFLSNILELQQPLISPFVHENILKEIKKLKQSIITYPKYISISN